MWIRAFVDSAASWPVIPDPRAPAYSLKVMEFYFYTYFCLKDPG